MVDDDGREVAIGKDLPDLQRRLREQLRATLTDAAGGLERTGLTDWPADLPDGALPRVVSTSRAGHTVTGHPALHDDGATVSVRVYESEQAQAVAMRAGTVRLLRLTTVSPAAAVVLGLDNRTKLTLGHNPYESVPALLDDCADCAADHLVAHPVARPGTQWGSPRCASGCAPTWCPRPSRSSGWSSGC